MVTKVSHNLKCVCCVDKMLLKLVFLRRWMKLGSKDVFCVGVWSGFWSALWYCQSHLSTDSTVVLTLTPFHWQYCGTVSHTFPLTVLWCCRSHFPLTVLWYCQSHFPLTTVVLSVTPFHWQYCGTVGHTVPLTVLWYCQYCSTARHTFLLTVLWYHTFPVTVLWYCQLKGVAVSTTVLSVERCDWQYHSSLQNLSIQRRKTHPLNQVSFLVLRRQVLITFYQHNRRILSCD
jgi:hypothetical protein